MSLLLRSGNLAVFAAAVILFASVAAAPAAPFVNLDFEQATVVVAGSNPSGSGISGLDSADR